MSCQYLHMYLSGDEWLINEPDAPDSWPSRLSKTVQPEPLGAQRGRVGDAV